MQSLVMNLIREVESFALFVTFLLQIWQRILFFRPQKIAFQFIFSIAVRVFQQRTNKQMRRECHLGIYIKIALNPRSLLRTSHIQTSANCKAEPEPREPVCHHFHDRRRFSKQNCSLECVDCDWIEWAVWLHDPVRRNENHYPGIKQMFVQRNLPRLKRAVSVKIFGI